MGCSCVYIHQSIGLYSSSSSKSNINSVLLLCTESVVESCHGEVRREEQKQAVIYGGRVESALVTLRYRRMDYRKINKPSGILSIHDVRSTTTE